MAAAAVKQADKAAAAEQIAASQKKAEELGAMAAAAVKQADKAAAKAAYDATLDSEWDVVSDADVAVAVAAAADETLAITVTKAAIAAALASSGEPLAAPQAAPVARSSSKETVEGALNANWAFLIVTERLWHYVVIGHDDEATARAHAAKMWSCWVMYRQVAAGKYEEIEVGGVSAPMTFGVVHKKIRKYVDANLVGLPKMARRASVVS